MPDDPVAAFVAALAALGLDTPVAVAGTLVLLQPPDVAGASAAAEALADPQRRAGIMAAARAAGYTHAALELPAAPPLDAPLVDVDA